MWNMQYCSFAKKIQSQIESIEKKLKTLLYKKAAQKMLYELTPCLFLPFEMLEEICDAPSACMAACYRQPLESSMGRIRSRSQIYNNEMTSIHFTGKKLERFTHKSNISLHVFVNWVSLVPIKSLQQCFSTGVSRHTSVP